VLLAALAAGAIGMLAAQDRAPQNKGRDADVEAVRANSREFTAAFNKGDAKAVAATWTEQGECHDAAGGLLIGRSAIEQAFAELFKSQPKAKVEVLIGSIRFPAPDVAVEEGMLRMLGTGKELPTTTMYAATHVRSGGRWLTAVSREWGAGHDRLDDIEWLIGTWRAAAPGSAVSLSFSRDDKGPYLLGKFTRTSGDKTDTGTMRIGLDPQSGRLRSWHFDADGGHGQALWHRDGNRWLMDAVGVLGDGSPTTAVNVLGRTGPDEITWQSIDRNFGDQALPNTAPIKLTRAR